MTETLQAECDKQVLLRAYVMVQEAPAPNFGRFTAYPVGHTNMSCLPSDSSYECRDGTVKYVTTRLLSSDLLNIHNSLPILLDVIYNIRTLNYVIK
jgi:hypothetical protein